MLEQSRDGMQSVLDGQALRIKSLLDTIGKQEATIQTLQSNLDYQNDLVRQHNSTIENMQKTIDQLTAKLSDLTTLTTKLNQDILNELGVLTGTNNQAQKKSKSQTSNEDVKSVNAGGRGSDDFTKLSNKEIIDQARKLYREKNLLESKKRYEWLVKNNYKVASSLYMLGEIEYQRSKFAEAISFYKKSTSLDDKASYMPILLWHTAWAFRYSKDMDNYNKFLDSLIRLYPESEQGRKAKDLRQKNKNKG
ncbi:periplasmic protein [Helicobacter canis]|uniref:Periplasmic protein n=2 Tax=Helicobacter canis TaxID=29419 RepID=A0A377J4K8_9HELI|nr:periplasmic protein [Helicobacter canis]